MIQLGSCINKRYKLIDQIGFGGMSTVFLARDQHSGETFAIKVMDYKIANDTDFLDRFEREAKIGLTLSHPNITKVLSYGKEDGTYYIIMEYVQGISLRQYARQNGCLPWEKAIPIFLQVLSALSYAYYKGIQAHRDLKPENIMIDTKSGMVKVMDFGIAKLQGSEMTQSSMVYSPNYAAPEQLMPSKYKNKISYATDLFCLSVVFYEMLTGKKPFPGNTPVEIIDKELTIPPKSPSIFNSVIPDWLSKIVMKSLNPNPALRYQTPEDMAKDLKSRKIKATNDNLEVNKTNSFYSERTDISQRKNKNNFLPLLISSIVVFVIGLIGITFWAANKFGTKYGSLDIQTQLTNADIYLDGNLVSAKTSTILKNLEIGYHNLTIKQEGFHDLGAFVNIEPNQTFIFKEKLDPLPKIIVKKLMSEVSITTTPEGANYFINNIYKGTTKKLDPTQSQDYISLEPGIYEILLSKIGYSKDIYKVELKPGKRTLHFSLTPLPVVKSKKEQKKKEFIKPVIIPVNQKGIAVIETEPGDALVYLNDVYVGDTPVEIFEKSGKYQLRITKKGYKDFPVGQIEIPNNNQKITKKYVLVLDIDIPTLISPKNESYSLALSPTFEWSSVEKAEYYELTIIDSVTKKVLFNQEKQKITATNFQLPNGYLQNGRSYTWNVKGGNKYGWGGASGSWIFYTEDAYSPPPPPPQVVKDKYKIYFSSNPPDARIYIGSEYTGLQTNTTIVLKPGKHLVWIWKDGYKKCIQWIDVYKDDFVYVTLERE